MRYRVKIDRTKIVKCGNCKNLVDLLGEDWAEKRLSQYAKLSASEALEIYYT